MRDLAFNKSAYQSSPPAPNNASLGIDHNMDTFFFTESESSPWWAVDLGQVNLIQTVCIVNVFGENSGLFTILNKSVFHVSL